MQDTEVSRRSVSIVLNKIKAYSVDVVVEDGCLYLETDGRTCVAYLSDDAAAALQ